MSEPAGTRQHIHLRSAAHGRTHGRAALDHSLPGVVERSTSGFAELAGAWRCAHVIPHAMDCRHQPISCTQHTAHMDRMAHAAAPAPRRPRRGGRGAGHTWDRPDVADEVVASPDAEVAAHGARHAGAVLVVRQPPAVLTPEDVLQHACASCPARAWRKGAGLAAGSTAASACVFGLWRGWCCGEDGGQVPSVRIPERSQGREAVHSGAPLHLDGFNLGR